MDKSNNLLSPQNNTPKAKSARTFLQSVVATVAAFLYGLWGLPGVSDYTQNFVKTQGFELLLGLAALIGLPAALLAYLQNKHSKQWYNAAMLHLIYSALVGVVVYLVGCLFDKTPNNKYAGIAGLVAFVLVFLGFAYVG